MKREVIVTKEYTDRDGVTVMPSDKVYEVIDMGRYDMHRHYLNIVDGGKVLAIFNGEGKLMQHTQEVTQ